ncbi:major facilitator superfamily transporter [Plectosphaerella plurivora]|uniref:Major facilitator superfamily transporter n=1 Tax=Plectosphaerella plurivora TaxID=936078 RepID=A0A9P9AAY5_9PEZI|nr:major facilitator superfamily transporter [Plectosphaerella plurivora]
MVFSSGLAQGSPPKHRAQAPAADETTPLLPGRRTSTALAPSSSGASSLTISSLDDSDEFVPWYADVERDAAAKNAAAASIREVAPTTIPAPVPATPEEEEAAARRKMVLRVVAILVVGMFTNNADGSLVLATHPTIASEFNDLADSSWLFTAFALAGAATQAIYAKLSDIYGRRALLVTSYSFFAVGCFIVGIGGSMWEVVLGRVVSGSAGSAMGIVSILLITDLVPLREVAAWQSYVNLASTTGRSLGGPLGGFLADTIGWRWSFIGQAPIFMFALLLCLMYLPSDTRAPVTTASDTPVKPAPKGSPLLRIDWLGAIVLALLILAFLTPLEIGGTKVPWTSPLIFAMFGAAAVLAALFVFVEGHWAREPIFPLALFQQRDVVVSYFITGCQTAAQLGLMFAVPLYFQVTQRTSNTVAGAHLFPAVAGNAVGGIMAGAYIRRTGRYKKPMVLATMCSSFSYLLLLLRWHGNTNIWESLYIVPGGFGMGVVQSAVFISVQASVHPSNKAAATSGMWLSTSIGMILGLATISSVVTETMKWDLNATLRASGLDEVARRKIIEAASSSVQYIDKADPEVAKAVVAAYVRGLTYSHAVSLFCALSGLAGTVLLREHKV